MYRALYSGRRLRDVHGVAKRADNRAAPTACIRESARYDRYAPYNNFSGDGLEPALRKFARSSPAAIVRIWIAPAAILEHGKSGMRPFLAPLKTVQNLLTGRSGTL